MLSVVLRFVRGSWRWLVTFQVVAVVGWLLSQGVTAESQVAHRSEAFRRALADGRSARAMSLISDDYRDPWGMGREEMGAALRDIIRQFLTLRVEWGDPQFAAGPEGGMRLTAKLRLEGKSLTPVGEMMLSMARQLNEPFTFHWKKEGWGPWSWRLVSITHPELELPAGYTPGMFSEAPASLEEAMSR